jgi:DeoR/GlpR family transcriptional regulator of sugar metabolism
MNVEKKIAVIKASLSGFTGKSGKLLENSEKVLRKAELFSLAHHRPELTAYLVSQWEFIIKTLSNRYEKQDICRRIVENYISNKSIILLDSGSSVDRVTYELLSSDLKGVNVYTNNVFAALHLVGERRVKLHLLSGVFSDRFAAVYSEESIIRIEGLSINVFILAATAIRFKTGIMVNKEDNENLKFKRAALHAFARVGDESILIIAVDGTKFLEPTEKHQGVFNEKEWSELISKYKHRIKLVTSPLRRDVEHDLQVQFNKEISDFEKAGVHIDIGEPL